MEPFHPNVISETILRRLLKQDIVVHIKKNKEWRIEPANLIYEQGKAVDYFVIIIEGRVEVTVGKENLIFEGGPFTYFGTQALVQTVGIGESEGWTQVCFSLFYFCSAQLHKDTDFECSVNNCCQWLFLTCST